jgi:hypothetical protein
MNEKKTVERLLVHGARKEEKLYGKYNTEKEANKEKKNKKLGVHKM